MYRRLSLSGALLGTLLGTYACNGAFSTPHEKPKTSQEKVIAEGRAYSIDTAYLTFVNGPDLSTKVYNNVDISVTFFVFETPDNAYNLVLIGDYSIETDDSLRIEFIRMPGRVASAQDIWNMSYPTFQGNVNSPNVKFTDIDGYATEVEKR